MSQRSRWLLALALASCSPETFQLDTPLPGSASCEELADHELAQCPELARDRALNIEECESNRLQYETIGCGAHYARLVLCMTAASGYYCDRGPIACSDELDQAARCRQRFTQQTGCARVERDDVCVGQPEPYAYSCIGSGPAGCGPTNRERTEAEQALNVGFVCCPSFSTDAVSYFAEPACGASCDAGL